MRNRKIIRYNVFLISDFVHLKPLLKGMRGVSTVNKKKISIESNHPFKSYGCIFKKFWLYPTVHCFESVGVSKRLSVQKKKTKPVCWDVCNDVKCITLWVTIRVGIINRTPKAKVKTLATQRSERKNAKNTECHALPALV